VLLGEADINHSEERIGVDVSELQYLRKQ